MDRPVLLLYEVTITVEFPHRMSVHVYQYVIVNMYISTVETSLDKHCEHELLVNTNQF